MVASSSGQQSFSSSTSVFSLFRVPDVRYCLNFILLRVARLMCASVREIRPLLPAGMLFLLLCGQCRENCFFECLPPLLINHFPAAVKSSLLVVVLFLGSYGFKRSQKSWSLSTCFIFYENNLDEITKIVLFLPFVNRIKTCILCKYGVAIFFIVLDIVL